MESLGLLGVQTVTNVSPLMPKPYFVAAAGIRLLRKSLADQGKEWNPFARDRKRGSGQSFPHVWHELATTEVLLSVWEATKERADLELLLTERRSLATHPAFRVSVLGRPVHVQPDALFLVRQSARGMMCCLLETDTGTESERQLAAKLERYRVWAESGTSRHYLCDLYRHFGATNPSPLFRIVFVACGIATGAADTRLDLLCRLPQMQPDWFGQRIWVAAAEGFAQSSTSLLSLPVWIRGEDVRSAPQTTLSHLRRVPFLR